MNRFLEAQDPVYANVLSELKRGRKTSHWMWFVFPQIEGLGSSEMARKYAIASLAEAAAYLAHPVLGARLGECTRLVNEIEGRAIGEIFGAPDDRKFHSSMTLFARASGGGVYAEALRRYFAGVEDPATLERLR